MFTWENAGCGLKTPIVPTDDAHHPSLWCHKAVCFQDLEVTGRNRVLPKHHTLVLAVSLTLKSLVPPSSWTWRPIEAYCYSVYVISTYQVEGGGEKDGSEESYHCHRPGPSANLLALRVKGVEGLKRKAKASPPFLIST